MSEISVKKYRDIRFVAYVHTLEAKNVIIESDREKGILRYINTGTCLPLIQEARITGFGISREMTLTFIFNQKENIVSSYTMLRRED